MTDNSSNFLSLEVVFQKKVSLQSLQEWMHTDFLSSAPCDPRTKKSLLCYKHEHLMDQKSLTKKKSRIFFFAKMEKFEISIWFMIWKTLVNELWRNLRHLHHNASYDVRNWLFLPFLGTLGLFRHQSETQFLNLSYFLLQIIFMQQSSSGKLNRKIV